MLFLYTIFTSEQGMDFLSWIFKLTCMLHLIREQLLLMKAFIKMFNKCVFDLEFMYLRYFDTR